MASFPFDAMNEAATPIFHELKQPPPPDVRFEMQAGPDRPDERGGHRLNDLETIQFFKPCPVTKSKIGQATFRVGRAGDDDMNSKAVLEDVRRRYRAIASLYRQTATLRPLQRASLLGQLANGSISLSRRLRPTLRMWPTISNL
jgi:hypothetical protein